MFVILKGILLEYYKISCYTTISYIWIVIFIICIGILEAIALIFALKIRNITINFVNDSKDVINIAFIITVISIVNFIFLFFLGNYSNISSRLIIMVLLIIATSVIILTFAPKVWQILLHPRIIFYID